MNQDRCLVVVLTDDRGDVDLIRYAARLARLNASAGRRAREVEPVPHALGTGFPAPADTGADPGLAPVLTDEGKAVMLRAARALRFVHVLPGPVSGACCPDRQQIARRLLGQVRAQLANGVVAVPVRCDVFQGRVFDHLRAVAAEEESDVLLIGKDRPLAERLVREAACSVWLVPDRSPATFRRILVPVDFSTRSADSLRVATALARLGGAAECLVVHVYFHNCLVPRPEEDRRIRDQLGAACARFQANIDCLGVKVTPLFREGASVARAVHRTAEEQGADLIVMASRGRTAAGARLLESVAEQAMRASAVPLLVVKHFGARMGMLRVLSERTFWQKNDLRFN
jgi:nucleotide-binding universal stress UspA family protein